MIKIALILERYFPYGGLQRDFMRIANALLENNFQVEIFTTAWEGEKLVCPLHIIPIKSFTHHSRLQTFTKKIEPLIKPFDLRVGFNKLPGLDYYFASDTCFAARQLGWKRWLPRYRSYLALEKAVFDKDVSTRIFILTLTQQALYQQHYHTASERFHLLPAGIPRLEISIEERKQIRQVYRDRYRVKPGATIFLMVASHFYTKGVDRSIEVLKYYKTKEFQLWILGGDDRIPFLKQAKQHGIEDRIQFIGAAPAQDYMLAANVLLHPARTEAAGMVLVEALTAGLPVITGEECGYAFHIQQAKAGKVLACYEPEVFKNAVAKSFDLLWQEQCRSNGLQYAKTTDLYHMTDKCLEFIKQNLHSI